MPNLIALLRGFKSNGSTMYLSHTNRRYKHFNFIRQISSSATNVQCWCCRTCRPRRWCRSRGDTPMWSIADLCRQQTQSAGSQCVCSGRNGNCPDCRTRRCGCP